jgi:hypothetical protein
MVETGRHQKSGRRLSGGRVNSGASTQAATERAQSHASGPLDLITIERINELIRDLQQRKETMHPSS